MKVYTTDQRISDYKAFYYTYKYNVRRAWSHDGYIFYQNGGCVLNEEIYMKRLLKSSQDLFAKYADREIRRLHTVMSNELGRGKQAIVQIDFTDGTSIYMDDPRFAREYRKARKGVK